MEESISQAILAKIESNSVGKKVFNAAVKMVYANMEKDLVPRFNKSFQEPAALASTRSEVANRRSVVFSP